MGRGSGVPGGLSWLLECGGVRVGVGVGMGLVGVVTVVGECGALRV